MKPKITYLIGDLHMGGWPTFLLNLCKGLRDDFEFSFIAVDNKSINPRFHELGKAEYLGNNLEAINHRLITQKPDIVQFGNKEWLGKIAKNVSNSIIVIERTAGPRSCNIGRSSVDYVIASNEGTIPLIRKNYQGPLEIIRNGLDVDYYKSVQPDRLHFKPDDFVVCYCARMGGRGQGFGVLLNAVLKARETHDVKLVLIGDKPEHSAEDIRPKLRKLAKPMGDDCVFTGALDNPAPIMAGANLYVCPAFHHGISNSIIEAAALGKPVVATDVGQTNEIVLAGTSGILVKPGDIDGIASAIIKLKDSPKKCQQYGQAGQELVEREFNVKKQALRYKELYKRLLAEYQK